MSNSDKPPNVTNYGMFDTDDPSNFGGENPFHPNNGPDNPPGSPSGPAPTDPEAKQKEKDRKSLERLYDIAVKNKDAAINKFNNSMDMYNISDEQAKRLLDAQTIQNKRNMGTDWFDQFKKLQQSADQLKRTAGGSLTGSNLYNLWDLWDSENDNIRKKTLDTQRKNQDELNNAYFDTVSSNVNHRNEMGLDTEYGIKQVANDYLAQRASMLPDEALGEKWDEVSGWGDNFYNEHKTGAAEVPTQGWYSEENAQQKANELQNKSTANASAANMNYWNNLISGYNRRY